MSGYSGVALILVLAALNGAALKRFDIQPFTMLRLQHIAEATRCDHRPAVVMAAADSSLLIVDARTGEATPSAGSSQSGYPWLRPKNPDTALGVFMLDAMAMPVSVPSCQLSLGWAVGSSTPGESGGFDFAALPV